MEGKQIRAFVVVRLSDEVEMAEFTHSAAAESFAAYHNRNLYNRGLYCEVREAVARA